MNDALTKTVAPLTATLLVAQQTAAYAAGDALFLANFPVGVLPYFIIAASVSSVPAAHWSGRVIARFGPASIAPATLALSSALFFVEWALLDRLPRVAVTMLHFHAWLVVSIGTSVYWSLLNERFDPSAAKRMLARVSAGAALGAILGGLGAERISALLDARALLFVLGAIGLMATAGTQMLRGSRAGRATQSIETAETSGAWRHIARSPYLRHLALIIGCTAVLTALLDYLLKADAAQSFTSGTLLRFFGLFYAATGTLAFLLQAGVGGTVLSRAGVAGSMAVHPIALGCAALLALALPVPWRSVLLCGTHTLVSGSIFRAGYELLYTPLAEGTKRRVKATIDVGVDSIGEGVGAGLIVILSFLGGRAWFVAAAVTAMVCAAEFLIARRLHAGYVDALKAGLRRRDAEVNDRLQQALSDFSLAPSVAGLDLDSVMRAAQRRSGSRARSAAVADVPGAADSLVAALEDLRSADANRARAALDLVEHDPILIAAAIPLLGRVELFRDAVKALCRCADAAAGQLVDALLNDRVPQSVRQHLPLVLQTCGPTRARDGLIEGLSDPVYEMRRSCSRALVELSRTRPGLALPVERMFVLAGQEFDRPGWNDRRLSHVFALLGLAVDREAMAIVRQVFSADDEQLRGTAIEYLEAVLPSPFAVRLLPRLTHAPVPSQSAARDARHLRTELVRWSDTQTRPDADYPDR